MPVVTWIKDALLCLLIVSVLSNMSKNKKKALVSLFIIVVLFMMGIDL